MKILDPIDFVIRKVRRRIEQCDLLKTTLQEIEIDTNYRPHPDKPPGSGGPSQ
ncbi:MAG: hypothetical protein VST70_09075 [Nitrospirota bacterium]|nr:hypothetical protein [Nitrospirota bacterium]